VPESSLRIVSIVQGPLKHRDEQIQQLCLPQATPPAWPKPFFPKIGGRKGRPYGQARLYAIACSVAPLPQLARIDASARLRRSFDEMMRETFPARRGPTR